MWRSWSPENKLLGSIVRITLEQTFRSFFFLHIWLRICGLLLESGESGMLTMEFVGFGLFALPPSKFYKFFRAEFWFWICGLLVESGEPGKLPLKFVGFAKFALSRSKFNSIAISENLPIRHSDFYNFFFCIFVLESADPLGIWRTRQTTGKILRICQIYPVEVKIHLKLRLQFWKFANKAALKNDIRYL